MAIKEIFLQDYKKPDFKCQDIDLIFDIFDEYTIVTNTMNLEKLDEINFEQIDL